jgi:hypothetical protein
LRSRGVGSVWASHGDERGFAVSRRVCRRRAGMGVTRM